MNFDYVVLWYKGSKAILDTRTFTSSDKASEYAEMKLYHKTRCDYAYKVICLN
jgi:hypothetical protein